jgi:predicted membrane-bound dolichyl-phosphate-mannose-protein mannosyltransferase
MGEVKDFKNITNWDELFDMTNEYLTFLVEQHYITHEMVIKTTHDIIKNAGYNYSYDDVEKEYYSGF